MKRYRNKGASGPLEYETRNGSTGMCSVITNVDAPWTHSFCFFIETYYIGMIDEVVGPWWLIQPLFPSSEVRGWDWKFQPSNHRLCSSGNQLPSILSCFPSHLINITRHLYCCPHLGNLKGFWRFVPGIGTNTKYIFLMISHNITHTIHIHDIYGTKRDSLNLECLHNSAICRDRKTEPHEEKN